MPLTAELARCSISPEHDVVFLPAVNGDISSSTCSAVVLIAGVARILIRQNMLSNSAACPPC